MSEEDTANAVAEASANGTAKPEKIDEPVSEKIEVEKHEMKEMEEDVKDNEKAETQPMDVDQEGKESNEIKEQGEKEEKEGKEKEEDVGEDEKEETKGEEMEEDVGVKEIEEKAGEKVDEPKEEEESVRKKGSKKLGRGKSAGEKFNSKKKDVAEKKEKEPKTPVASGIDRPVRERKSVERLVASIEKDAVKEVHIEKGRGTALKDIPNVAYKLSRRKIDEPLKLLHTILYGRRGKAIQVKNNISRFSGFVWNENEEKQKTKVKEKFDKCVKEKLLEFCDMLDIPIAKATTRKEDIVVKLIDFLMAPHSTTTELLADKEQSSKGKKRKRAVKGSASMSGSTPPKSSVKTRKKIESTSKGEEKKSTPESEDELEEENEEEHEEEDNENGIPERSNDEMPEPSESEEKENESEDESEEETRNRKRSSKKSPVKKESTGKSKTKKITVTNKSSPPPKIIRKRSSSGRSKVDGSVETSPKTFSRKKKNEDVVKKSTTPTKSATKEKTGKKVAKGEGKPKEDKIKPSDDELRKAICEILKEVDFNTATFTDILKQLAGRFNTDLTPRKSSIKLMIQDELTKLADEADDDEEDEGDAEKEENPPSSHRVEA